MALDITQPIEDIVRDLVNIASVSHHEAEIADAVESALRALPLFTVERVSNNVVARTHQDRACRVMLAGHLDTVPPNGNEGARDGVDDTGQPAIFGIGSCDMKGGVAALLSTLHSMNIAGGSIHDVTAVFYECEEVSGVHNGLGILQRERPDLLKADMAVLAEPSNAGIEAGCQGTLRVRVTTTGVRAHTARAWKGVNAIHAAAPILQRLVDYIPREPVVQGLHFHEGLQAVGIKGGVAGNVVPDGCTVTVNYRFAPDRDEAAATAHVREVFDGFEVTVVDCAVGALPHMDAPAIADFVELFKRRSSAPIAPKLGWTDVARFAAMGVPAINFGPGDPSLAHAAGEFVSVQQLHTCVDVLAQWLIDGA